MKGHWKGARGLAAVMSLFAPVALTACGGGSSPPSAPNAQPSPRPSAPPPGWPAGATTLFSNQTTLRNIDYDFGFSQNMNPMVRQFAGGAASGDIDADGDLDLFILRGDIGPNLLFLNDGGVSFQEAAAAAGLAFSGGATNGRHSGPVFGDLDGDGDLDLVYGGLEGDGARLYLNDGSGLFSNATNASGLQSMTSIHTISLALGDYDKDGDLDIAMSHWGTPRDPANPGETETLWRNDTVAGVVKFTPVSASSGVASLLQLNAPQGVLGPNFDYTFSPSFGDVDGDGDLDMLNVSDFRGSRIFLGRGDGSFGPAPFTPDDENGMGAAVGDYDNDGDPDWFVSSINGNRLYQNLGGGRFRRASESGVEPGGWGWGSCFADFNSDGWLDIYQTNGWDAGKVPSFSAYVEDTSRLWMNNGDGTFTDRAAVSTMLDKKQGRGVVCDDFDNDGDVDALLLTIEPQRSALYWDNQLPTPNYLKVDLKGRAPNTYAIGARIEVTVAGVMQTRFVNVNSNFTSHNSPRQYFGLASHSSASLRVIWPSGAETIIASTPANQTLVLREPKT
jgi:hypothetical protein